MAEGSYYIVHGAKMCCSAGSNSTRLNLPRCHGVYTGDKAFVHEDDCKFEVNISMFGICQNCQGETVGFVSDLDTEFSKAGEPAFGAMCKPMLESKWDGVHPVTKVDGKSVLTAESFLICNMGGVIQFMTSGQEEE